MDSQREQEFEYRLLCRVAGAVEPVGATTLAFDIGAEFGVSQATIGRKLLELDTRGYTRRLGNRGRVVTALGEARRRSLEDSLMQRSHQSDLMGALTATDLETLVDVLVARRALEREICRLAAERATAEDIAALRQILDNEEQAVARGRIPHSEDLEFHDTLAQVSGNRILRHALKLVRGESTYSPMVSLMRRAVGRPFIAEHRRILAAIEARSPAAADEAVTEHINYLIEEVRRYFAIFGRTGNHDVEGA